MYRRCSQLTLDRFITCIVDGDLTALVISGSPTSEELAVAWGEIYYEYVDLSADNETRFILTLEREISLLHDHIANVEAFIYFLQPSMYPFSKPHIESIMAELKEYGHRIKIDFTKDYSKKLRQLEGQLAPYKVELQQKEREYESFIQGREGNQLDREHFTTILSRLGRYQGYAVRAKETTVSEYVAMLKDYVQYLEQSKKQGVADE